MKRLSKQLVAAVMGVMLCCFLAACSSSKDIAYPVNLDGTEIIVGETALSALYDAGFTVMALNMEANGRSSEVEASYQLDADSYYTGMYVTKGDVEMATIAIVTESKACPASEAIIGTVEVNSELEHAMDKATFHGVPMMDLTAKTFQELVPGSSVREDGTSAYISGKKYTVRVDYENGTPISVEMTRKYDVDYSA